MVSLFDALQAHCLKVHQLEQEEISNYIDFEPWSLVYAGWEREYRLGNRCVLDITITFPSTIR